MKSNNLHCFPKLIWNGTRWAQKISAPLNKIQNLAQFVLRLLHLQHGDNCVIARRLEVYALFEVSCCRAYDISTVMLTVHPNLIILRQSATWYSWGYLCISLPYCLKHPVELIPPGKLQHGEEKEENNLEPIHIVLAEINKMWDVMFSCISTGAVSIMKWNWIDKP